VAAELAAVLRAEASRLQKPTDFDFVRDRFRGHLATSTFTYLFAHNHPFAADNMEMPEMGATLRQSFEAGPIARPCRLPEDPFALMVASPCIADSGCEYGGSFAPAALKLLTMYV